MTATAEATQSAPGLMDIPGPEGGRLLGVGLEFRDNLLEMLTRDMREYGDVVRYPLGPKGTPLRAQVVAVHHPRDVQQVLTQTERTFSKDTLVFRAMAEMLGRGLLTSWGDEWKRQRRVVQPLFTPRRVEGYLGLMGEEAAAVVAGSPADGGTVDLHLLMTRYTLRVVGRALFGDDVEDLVPALHELVHEGSREIRRRMFRTVRAPLSWPVPGNLRARRLRARVYAIVDEVLRRSSSSGSSSGAASSRGAAPGGRPSYGERDDLVARLRRVPESETGRPLSAEEVRDQALIFLMAGHETTAGALTCTLHLLGRHPDVQDAVAAEARDVLGEGEGAGTAVTPAHVARLRLARAALQEGLRLFPSAHATDRVTTEPLVLGGYRLPAGQLVLVSPWSTHRHPDFWPDPERFDPGRFLGEQDRPRYAYFPFGGGPRACIGEQFAMLEAVTLLATLLRERRLTSLRPDLPVEPIVTLRPAGAVPVSLERR